MTCASLVLCGQVRRKPACSATEASWSLVISDIEFRGILLFRERIAKMLIRLRGCTECAGSLLSANNLIKQVFVTTRFICFVCKLASYC